MHLLSTPEVSAALLALYCPSVYDIHEQRLLSTVPAAHPLQGSPRHDGLPLPPLRGTVHVAASMGVLAQHPKIFFPGGGDEASWVPFPYCGDLLLFLQDAEGVYCVNWNVKLRPEDYSRPGRRMIGRTRLAPLEEKADLRHKIEDAYYRDADIRTIRVTSQDIDHGLVANLRAIFGWHSRAMSAPALAKARAIEMFRDSIGGTKTAFQVAEEVAKATGVSVHDAKAIMYQAIWQRALSVDLFAPLLMDRPLAKSERDPIDVYADWFRRNMHIGIQLVAPGGTASLSSGTEAAIRLVWRFRQGLAAGQRGSDLENSRKGPTAFASLTVEISLRSGGDRFPRSNSSRRRQPRA
jgi:hypothetical protein